MAGQLKKNALLATFESVQDATLIATNDLHIEIAEELPDERHKELRFSFSYSKKFRKLVSAIRTALAEEVGLYDICAALVHDYNARAEPKRLTMTFYDSVMA